MYTEKFKLRISLTNGNNLSVFCMATATKRTTIILGLRPRHKGPKTSS